MKAVKLLAGAAVAAFLVTGCDRGSEGAGAASDQDNVQNTGVSDSSDGSPSTVAPDNTGRNERDRAGGTLTPGDQGSSEADLEITRRVRSAITDNDQLSANAKNIKIITTNGKVTVRGPVKNAEEQRLIESIIKGAGVQSFDNQLEVNATSQPTTEKE